MTDHQHFVTQAILRNFSSSKNKDKIFAILHTNNKLQIKSNPINRIFEQNRYFTTSAGNYDSWFREIDSQAPPIIASIIENGVEKLNLQEREKINKFIALQWFRCVGIRNLISSSKTLEDHKKEYLEFKQEIRDLDKQKKISLDDLKNDQRWSDVINHLDKMLGEDYIKSTHAGLFTGIEFLIQKLSDLTLSSVSPKSLNKESEYVISGSPVLYNVWEPEFYFPISPTNCLRFHSNNSSLSPLDSRFINELQFINGEGYNGFRVAARYRETLEYLENTPLKYDEIQNLEDSFWKCLFLEMYKKNQAAKKVSG